MSGPRVAAGLPSGGHSQGSTAEAPDRQTAGDSRPPNARLIL
jgi:hypothetical protein